MIRVALIFPTWKVLILNQDWMEAWMFLGISRHRSTEAAIHRHLKKKKQVLSGGLR